MQLIGAKIRNFFKITKRNDDSGGTGEFYPKIVKIPHYQRPFKWGEEQIEKLIKDWDEESRRKKELGNDGSPKYFAGAVVTVVSETGKEKHQLIDGQQRVTTQYLANYLLFLIYRILIRQAIYFKDTYRLPNYLRDYLDTIKYLFNVDKQSLDKINNRLDNLLSEFVNLINKRDGEFNEKKEIDVCNEIFDYIFLPIKAIIADEEKYFNEHSYLMLKLIEKYGGIKLIYDRTSYNDKLKSAMSKVMIKATQSALPELITSESFGDDLSRDETTRSYVEAMKVIFSAFKEIVNNSTQSEPDSKPEEELKNIADLIKEFLSDVSFCVVQTGNANDAYILFEVLNDRSLALDDLDLVKNLFYKYFVFTNERSNQLGEKEIDTKIQKIDSQWVENIFKEQSDHRKKLIAYLALSYITGDSTLNHKEGKGFRFSLEEYLKLREVTGKEISRFFNIFEIAKEFVDVFDVKLSHQFNQAITAEFEIATTITYKTINLLVALSMEGVLAGVFNFIVNKYKSDSLDYDPEYFKNKFKKIKKQNDSFAEIHKQSFELWKAAIGYSKYNEPRALAIKIIEKQNYNKEDSNIEKCDRQDVQHALANWLDLWSYDTVSTKEKFKLRILFSRLWQFRVDPENPKYLIKTNQPTIPTDPTKIQLDHLEPSVIDDSRIKSDYYPLDDPRRIELVNAIGNMMPLLGKENASKRNKPLSRSFKHFDDINHGIVAQTKNLLSKYNTSNLTLESALDQDKVIVPSSEFFDERKKLLKGWFLQLLDDDPFTLKKS